MEQKLEKERLNAITVQSNYRAELDKVRFDSDLIKNSANPHSTPPIPHTADVSSESHSNSNTASTAAEFNSNNISAEFILEQEKLNQTYEEKFRELKDTLLVTHQEEIANMENCIADRDLIIETIKEENRLLSSQVKMHEKTAEIVNELRAKLEGMIENNSALTRELSSTKSELNEVASINCTLKYNIDILQKQLDVEDTIMNSNESFVAKRFKFSEDTKRDLIVEDNTFNGPLRIQYVCPDGKCVVIQNLLKGNSISLKGFKLVQKLPSGKTFEHVFDDEDEIEETFKLSSDDLEADEDPNTFDSLLSIGAEAQLTTFISKCSDMNPVTSHTIKAHNVSSKQSIFSKLVPKSLQNFLHSK